MVRLQHRLVKLVVAAAGAASLVSAALADEWPSRPIRMVVASAPGGNIDLVARAVGNRLAATFGQPVVIDNKAGAAGNIATDIVSKAAPDGYTLLMVATSHSTNLHLHPKLSFDPVRDFQPISQVGTSQFALAVHPSSGIRTLAEFIAHAKARTDRLNYASAGNGQANHLGMELLKATAGFEAVHVPYTSMAAAQTALMGKQVDAAILSLPGAVPAAKAGRLRLLATTGRSRSALTPEVPTIAELGFAGYEVSGWQGLLAPAGTPPAVVQRLHDATVKALQHPEAAEQLVRGSVEAVGSSPREFGEFIDVEIRKWGKVIRQAGIKAE